jgi:hypothetical protein
VVSEPPPPPAQASAPALQHLRDIHKIIVQSKQPDLDEDLKAALQAELGSRVEIVRSAAAADAILRIDVADEQSGKVAGAAGRVFGVKGKHKAVAQVVDRRQGRVLWSAEAGDRQAVVGAFGDGAKRLASRIAKQLRKDWDK